MVSKRLLIVDDDRATRDALQRMFFSRGWEVVVVTTELEALTLLGAYDPDWIVIPWDQMAGTGERFMSIVQAKSTQPRVVLLVSSLDGFALRQVARLKTDFRFRKPVLVEEIYQACEGGAKQVVCK